MGSYQQGHKQNLNCGRRTTEKTKSDEVRNEVELQYKFTNYITI